MRLTLSTSTANWITDRQLRSVWTTTLAMLRWTNTSPGAMSMIWLAGTRESEQPIHRYSGACCLDSLPKNSGSSRLIRSDHSRFFSSRSASGLVVMVLSQVQTDVLGVGEESHGLHAALASQAGRAHAAERRAQVALQPGIDPDHAGAQLRGEAMGAVEVAGPDRGGQAVVAVVGERQRLLVAVERLQRDDRAEDLVAVARALRPQAFDDGRRDEPAWPVERLAAAQHMTAFVAGAPERAGDLVEVRLRDQWAELVVLVDRVAHAQRGRALDQGVAELAVYAPFDQDARAAQADLPGVLEGRAHQRVEVLAPLAVGEHQRGILAAKFQRHLLEQGAGQSRDAAADRRAAGKGDRLDPRMDHQRLADLGA